MTAAVYIVGGPGDREDLRYSIRSLVNAPVIDEVWVVGDVPDWFGGVKMPLEPLPEKFANQRNSITRFVNCPGAPDRFYLFNDDMFVTERVEGVLPVVRGHGQTGLQWATDHREKSSSAGRCVPECYQCAVGETAAWTAEQTDTDPLLYEAHVPLPFATAALRDVLAAYPADQPFAVGEVYPIAGCGGPGANRGNSKCKQPASFTDKLALRIPYLSCSPQTWKSPVGPHIRRMFGQPSRYETDLTMEAAA